MKNRPTGKSRLQTDIHRLLTTLMQREIDDPKLFGITVTRLEPSKARQGMTVFVHRMDESDPVSAVERLNKMRPHFEHELRRALPKRRFPSLQFRWDDVFDKSGSVMDLLSRIERS
ncbi:MAG: 30S ribosome-binding factor RbfA [Mariprofundaceae bacterium]